MIDTKTLDELAQNFAKALPPGLREFQQDMEKNARAFLQTALHKLELVSREEFDVQSAVLGRTREKVEQLERRLAELEARLKAG